MHIGRLILNLIKPTSGSVLFLGQDITKVDKQEWRRLRGEMQLVFQNPLVADLQGREPGGLVPAGALHVHRRVPRASAVRGEVWPDLTHGAELHVVREERVVARIDADFRERSFGRLDGGAAGGEEQHRILY